MIEQQILNYLQDHRQAGDTLEGITRWWLLRQRVNDSVLLVQQTLEELIAKGDILERQLPDGRSVYLLKEQDA